MNGYRIFTIKANAISGQGSLYKCTIFKSLFQFPIFTASAIEQLTDQNFAKAVQRRISEGVCARMNGYCCFMWKDMAKRRHHNGLIVTWFEMNVHFWAAAVKFTCSAQAFNPTTIKIPIYIMIHPFHQWADLVVATSIMNIRKKFHY